LAILVGVASRRLPDLDDELRRRLGRRFGPTLESWLDALPPRLDALAERWQIEFDSLVQRGTVSVVIRTRTADGRSAVRKVSPDRRRIRDEAAALARWDTIHVPTVLAVDEEVGALLIESIEPGTALVDSTDYPTLASVASLLRSLHAHGMPDPMYPQVADRVTYLFESSRRLYELKPDFVGLISQESYERSRKLALQLAVDPAPTVLLHGDLTPVNVLASGNARGLVAIDPAPCLGDPAFDAIDLVLWRAETVETITARVEQLAPVIGADPGRLFDWCAAFAGMAALEIAERSVGSPAEIEPLLAVATRV
jgi:streptomycin 6-kinase